MTADEVADAVGKHSPSVVAVDGPRVLAPDGQVGRPCDYAFLDEEIWRLRLTQDRASERHRRSAIS